MTKPGKRDFLTLRDLQADELRALVARAIELKAMRQRGEAHRVLEGQVLAMIFEKSSTRTRVSFEVGMFELGGHAVHLAGQGSQIARGEPIEDTARVLSGYCSGILIRTFGHERLEALAAMAPVPVFNGLTDRYHPCQVVADLQTVFEVRGTLDGLRYAWVGDGNNMAHSWIEAAALLGLELAIACPAGYEPDAGIVASARQRMAETGQGSLELVRDPRDAVRNSDVVSTDVWASMGQEEEAAARRQAFASYCVDEALLAEARATPTAKAIVLHCLPAHRGEEISAQVLEGPQSAVWQQAENRLHAQKAILEAFLDGRA